MLLLEILNYALMIIIIAILRSYDISKSYDVLYYEKFYSVQKSSQSQLWNLKVFGLNQCKHPWKKITL